MPAIYSIEARDSFLLKTLYEYFNLSANDFKKEIGTQYDTLARSLTPTGVKYNDFRCVLTPSNGKDRFEQLFAFRLTPNDNEVYEEVSENIIPLLDKDSRLNILAGDLIIFGNDLATQYHIISLLHDTLGVQIDDRWRADYFLVYINNISKTTIKSIDAFFKNKNYYMGTADLTFDSDFKSYISHVSVATRYVKIEDKVFNADADVELTECSNINNGILDWEGNGYKVFGINDALFNTFLRFKIDTVNGTISSDDDRKINTIFITSDEEEKLPINQIIMDELKYDYLENEKQIFERIGVSKKDFLNEINKKILNQSLYNIEFKEGYNNKTQKNYSVVTFNIFLEFKNKNKNYFEKYTLGLTYNMNTKQILVGTMY